MNDTQLESIIRDYGRDILCFCRMTAGSREEGDELYQDTMLTLLEKLERVKAEENVKSYALSIALKLWQNRKRKYARRLRLAPQESLEELTEQGIAPGEDTASPEEIHLRRREILRIREIVRGLPEKYRVPIHLYFSANLQVKDIARVLKLPENTVKSRLRRGKDRIRQKLEEDDDG